MKSTPLTQGITMLILALYLLYGFFALPFAGLLLSLAVGLITYGSTESFEVAVSCVIVAGVLYSLITRSAVAAALQERRLYSDRREGFANQVNTVDAISQRVANMAKARGPQGVVSSAFVEGFADAAAAPNNASGQTHTEPSTDANSQATTKPASAEGSGEAGSGIAPPQPPAVTAAVHDAMKSISGFKGAEDKGLFKLGVLPEETKGGFHIDQGTTVMNALNALKPDQVKAMTEDTKKLIETQKNLMGMLGSMKPMLQDGKQMMETFQEMFGNGKEFKLA
jgi:hypothetical protein